MSGTPPLPQSQNRTVPQTSAGAVRAGNPARTGTPAGSRRQSAARRDARAGRRAVSAGSVPACCAPSLRRPCRRPLMMLPASKIIKQLYIKANEYNTFYCKKPVFVCTAAFLNTIKLVHLSGTFGYIFDKGDPSKFWQCFNFF